MSCGLLGPRIDRDTVAGGWAIVGYLVEIEQFDWSDFFSKTYLPYNTSFASEYVHGLRTSEFAHLTNAKGEQTEITPYSHA